MSGADCTPAPDVTHRHIRGVLGLHCAGGRAGTGDVVMMSALVVCEIRTNEKFDGRVCLSGKEKVSTIAVDLCAVKVISGKINESRSSEAT